MPGKIFLDTNILLYAYSSEDPLKREVCEIWLARKNLYVSVAVLNEFCNILRRKYHRRGSEIEASLNELMQYVDVLDVGARDIRDAIYIGERNGLGHFDALHLACASRHRCDIFVTEDKALQGFSQGGLSVLNPFAA